MKLGIEKTLVVFPVAETVGGMDPHVLKNYVGLSSWHLL